MDLARAPRRRPLTARKKGSGYENERVYAVHRYVGTSLVIAAEGSTLFFTILVPRALLTRGQRSATRGSGQIHIKLASDWLQRRLLF